MDIVGKLTGKILAMYIVNDVFKEIKTNHNVTLHYKPHKLHDIAADNEGFWLEFPNGSFLAFGSEAEHHPQQGAIIDGVWLCETWYILKDVYTLESGLCGSEHHKEDGCELCEQEPKYKNHYLAVDCVLSYESLKNKIIETLLDNNATK